MTSFTPQSPVSHFPGLCPSLFSMLNSLTTSRPVKPLSLRNDLLSIFKIHVAGASHLHLIQLSAPSFLKYFNSLTCVTLPHTVAHPTRLIFTSAYVLCHHWYLCMTSFLTFFRSPYPQLSPPEKDLPCASLNAPSLLNTCSLLYLLTLFFLLPEI